MRTICYHGAFELDRQGTELDQRDAEVHGGFQGQGGLGTFGRREDTGRASSRLASRPWTRPSIPMAKGFVSLTVVLDLTSSREGHGREDRHHPGVLPRGRRAARGHQPPWRTRDRYHRSGQSVHWRYSPKDAFSILSLFMRARRVLRSRPRISEALFFPLIFHLVCSSTCRI